MFRKNPLSMPKIPRPLCKMNPRGAIEAGEGKRAFRGAVCILFGMRTSTALLAILAATFTTLTALAEDKPAPAPAPAPAAADPAAPAAAEAPLDPKALTVLKEKKGQKVTLEGTIAASGEGKTAVRRYLNFTKNFRESVSLVFLVSKNPEEFSKEKLAAWVGKKVRATGTLTEYSGSLQIEIEKLDQIVEVK